MSTNSSEQPLVAGSMETKTKESIPVPNQAVAPLPGVKTKCPGERTVSATGAQGKPTKARSGFLPHAPSPENVACLLSEHLAELRVEPPRAVLEAYNQLDAGFHLVFERELCLRHEELTTEDHKGKRPLWLIHHERLVQAVRSTEAVLKLLARLLEKGRIEAVKAANKAEKGRHATKPLTIDVSRLIAGANSSHQSDVVLEHIGLGMEASWTVPLKIDFEAMEEITSLKDLHAHQKLGLTRPLKFCAFLGGGGGSDVIQAAAVAKLLRKANPIIKVLALISIRTLYSKSTSAGKKRSVWRSNDGSNPKTNLLDSANGDLKIEAYHRGNARFVEDAIAADFSNIRLVIDDKSQDLLRRSRYEGAIGKDVDSMIIIDTGGDVLGGMDPSATRKTPDQDCRTQLATSQIAAAKNLNAIVAIAALGVDAPPDAQKKLEESKAVYYRFTDDDKRYLTALYEKWHFNGSTQNLNEFPEHYGKTPFAMLASFKLKVGESGFQALPLPRSVINDFGNPWACITWVTPEMSCLVLVNQAKLLSVIAPERRR